MSDIDVTPVGLLRTAVSYVQVASTVVPPAAATVYARPLAATSQRYQVPTAWLQHWVTFHAIDGRAHVVFGTSSVVAHATQDSAVASEVLTPNAQTSVPIEAGSERQWFIDAETYFAVISTAAIGRWVAEVSSPLRVIL